MIGIIRTTDGKVTVIDGEVGIATAPSEYEAFRELDRRKDTRPAVETYSPWRVPRFQMEAV